MTLTLELSEERATALRAKAAAEWLSLEAWIEKLAEPMAPDANVKVEKLAVTPEARANDVVQMTPQ
jgi:hypothetical protein